MGKTVLWPSNVGNYRAGIRDLHFAHVEKWSIKCKQIKLPDGPGEFIPVIFTAPPKPFPCSRVVSLVFTGMKKPLATGRVCKERCVRVSQRNISVILKRRLAGGQDK